MQYRTFGRTGWSVSEIGYGMWGLAGWTGSDDDETMAALERAVELGCNFFDTAWAYGDGRSEQMLGRLVRNHPDKELYRRHQGPAQEPQWPSRRGYHARRLFPARPHPRICREEPAEPGADRGSTCSSSTSGKTPGPTTSAGSGPSTT